MPFALTASFQVRRSLLTAARPTLTSVRSVWLSPGFPAAPAALLDSLGADYTLAPTSTTPPAGSIAVVTGFERDLLSQLATRPADTSLVVVTPPDAPLPANQIPDLRADAVVPAASIAEVAAALRRLPAPVAPAQADTTQDLPWWIRPSQATPAAAPTSGGQPPHDTAVFATAPLPAFGQPVDPSAVTTETLAMGSDEPPRRRFALTGRQARIASIAAVVIAMAATGVAVALDSHSPSTSNTAATSPFGGTNNGGGNNTSPFGNSNGSSSSNGSSGSNGLNGQDGTGTAPQFGNQDPFGGQSGHSGQSGQSGQGTRREELEQFLACLKQNGVSINGNSFRSLDPSDPKLRTALNKCASLMPFGRFRGGFGGSSSGNSKSSGTNGSGTNGNGTNGSGTSSTGSNGSHTT